jgi:hypothetical protein
VSSEGADKLRARYALPSDFDFDDFPNWVPSHPGCNKRKGQLAFDPSPELLYQLPSVQMMAKVAEATAEQIQNNQKSARTC